MFGYQSIVRYACVAVIFTVSAIQAHAAGSNATDYVPGKLVVKYKPMSDDILPDGSPSESISELKARFGITHSTPFIKSPSSANGISLDSISVRNSGLNQIRELTLDGRHSVEDAVAAFNSHVDVEYAEPVYIYKTNWAPNDTYWGTSGAFYQSYLDLYGLDKLGMEQAWDIERGDGIVIAVIDTGLTLDHEDIQANVWTNAAELPNGVDDDGNGYVDDIHGWDFVLQQPEMTDPHGHGSHVAGTIAATGNNNIGIIGVAPNAAVMPVRGLDDNGSGSSFNLANCIIYAVDAGADILNNSWGGGGYSQVIHDAIKYAHDNGVVVVAAAGNENEDAFNAFPAQFPEVITVAATDHNDSRAWFSNKGRAIDVAAPGVQTLSNYTKWASVGEGSFIVDDNYLVLSGTSMASPHVAGVAALLLAQDSTRTPEQIRYILRNHSDDIGDAGRDDSFGYGRVNANAALSANASAPDIYAAITSPRYQNLNGREVIFVGSANGNDFSHFELSVKLFSESAYQEVATGTSQVSDSILSAVDFSDLGNGYYIARLRVYDSLGRYTENFVEFNVEFQLLSNYPSVFIRGTHNGWQAVSSMTLVDNYLWEQTITADGNFQFKFDVYGDWSFNFGDNNNDGYADQRGDNILVNQGQADFVITFNEQTNQYAVTKLDGPVRPVAIATADTTAVRIGETIFFTGDQSYDPDGTIVSYRWTGAFNSSVANPTSTRFQAGTFTATLTVTDNDGDSSSDEVTFVVTGDQFPEAAISVSPSTDVALGTVVTFSDNSSDDGEIVSRQWSGEFDDNAESVSWEFNQLGSFDVQLSVTDDAGQTSETSVTINVTDDYNQNLAELHLAGSHNGWNPNDPAFEFELVSNHLWRLEANLTSGGRFKFTPGSWSGSYGDNNGDGVADTNGGGNINVPAGTSSYIIEFNDESLAYSVEEVVGPKPPVAVASADRTSVRVGETVEFSSAASYDPDGSIVSVLWEDAFDSTSSTYSTSFDAPGSYVAQLTVMDNDGLTDIDWVTITVSEDTAPNASIDVSPGTTVAVGTTVSFNDTSTDDGIIVGRVWTGILTGSEPTRTYTFNDVGEFTATLTVSDDAGNSSETSVTIAVTDDFDSNEPAIYLAGSHNGWNPADSAFQLELVGNHTWRADVALVGGGQFKFTIGNWSKSFGDNNGDGIADTAGGGNIPVNQGTYSYTVTFNDETLAYSLTPNVGPQAPNAVAGSNLTVAPSETFTLDGSASNDPDGNIVEGSWACDDLGQFAGLQVTLTYPSEGVYNCTLAVIDNDGLSDSDTLIVTVQETVPESNYPSMFLRGSHNSWSTSTPMVLVDDYLWEVTVTLSATGQYKFDADGNWQINFGDNNQDGVAERSGGNINVSQGNGVYRVRFNDQTRVYSAVHQ